jgi:hypothetical protein
MDKTQNQREMTARNAENFHNQLMEVGKLCARGSGKFNIQMLEAARLAIELGMSVGESSEAARIMAQELGNPYAIPKEDHKQRKANHRAFIKKHNGKRGHY